MSIGNQDQRWLHWSEFAVSGQGQGRAPTTNRAPPEGASGAGSDLSPERLPGSAFQGYLSGAYSDETEHRKDSQ